MIRGWKRKDQLDELEDGLEESGLSAWGEDVERLREQPFEKDIFFMAVTYPPDVPLGSDSTAQLLAIGESGVESATLAVEGKRASVERVVDQLDLLGAETGTDRLLKAAQVEAEMNGGKPPTTPLFGRDDGGVRHIDGGGTAHWFARLTKREEPDTDSATQHPRTALFPGVDVRGWHPTQRLIPGNAASR